MILSVLLFAAIGFFIITNLAGKKGKPSSAVSTNSISFSLPAATGEIDEQPLYEKGKISTASGRELNMTTRLKSNSTYELPDNDTSTSAANANTSIGALRQPVPDSPELEKERLINESMAALRSMQTTLNGGKDSESARSYRKRQSQLEKEFKENERQNAYREYALLTTIDSLSSAVEQSKEQQDTLSRELDIAKNRRAVRSDGSSFFNAGSGNDREGRKTKRIYSAEIHETQRVEVGDNIKIRALESVPGLLSSGEIIYAKVNEITGARMQLMIIGRVGEHLAIHDENDKQRGINVPDAVLQDIEKNAKRELSRDVKVDLPIVGELSTNLIQKSLKKIAVELNESYKIYLVRKSQFYE